MSRCSTGGRWFYAQLFSSFDAQLAEVVVEIDEKKKRRRREGEEK